MQWKLNETKRFLRIRKWTKLCLAILLFLIFLKKKKKKNQKFFWKVKLKNLMNLKWKPQIFISLNSMEIYIKLCMLFLLGLL